MRKLAADVALFFAAVGKYATERPLRLYAYAALPAMAIYAFTTNAHDRSELTGITTCKGDYPCVACKNCTQCKYCHQEGGYCGVCSKSIPESERR
jgi:hypothetical protein